MDCLLLKNLILFSCVKLDLPQQFTDVDLSAFTAAYCYIQGIQLFHSVYTMLCTLMAALLFAPFINFLFFCLVTVATKV